MIFYKNNIPETVRFSSEAEPHWRVQWPKISESYGWQSTGNLEWGGKRERETEKQTDRPW
jgi:hypothetical protein